MNSDLPQDQPLSGSSDVTVLLHQWRGGNANALNALMPLLYRELRTIASRVLGSGDARSALQPTVVLHEAYLRLVQSGGAPQDRTHFFALAATVMRHVVLDWAKGKARGKRGGGLLHQTLDDGFVGMDADPTTILEVDRLLEKLESFDARKARVVEMIFFGGLTYDEVATALDISPVTVHRELRMAKAWMRAELLSTPSAGSLAAAQHRP